MARDLSQEALAESAGIASRYLQDVEVGAANISLGVLVDLALALGVDERALLKPARLQPARVGRPPKTAL